MLAHAHASSSRRVFACVGALVLCLGACSAASTDDDASVRSSSAEPESTVTVEKRDIVPTLSTKATVEQAGTFVVSTLQPGTFKPLVKPGSKVTVGQILGWNGGVALRAPADAVVRTVAAASDALPAHYAVFDLEYQGFALSVDATALVDVAPIESVTGKFQIDGGIGPTDIQAIVAAPEGGEPVAPVDEASSAGAPVAPEATSVTEPAMAPEISSSGSHVSSEQADQPRGSSSSVLCLIAKDQPVRPGQIATVVLAGKAKRGALAVPVSAVAGREVKGTVSVMRGRSGVPVEVGLGVSDGAYIEVTSGLESGETISAVAPYLDPRKK